MSATPQLSPVAKMERKTLIDLIESGKRLDGRTFSDYRPIKIRTGIIEKANGSSFVELGKTKVMVGVKVELGEPFEDTPDQGVLTVNVELVPLAYPTFEPGPPNENAIELARIVDRGLRESEAIGLGELCLIPGKKVLVIFIDIYVLDYDGNLIDSSALASLAALLTSKIPKYTVKGEEKIEAKGEDAPLPIRNYPIAITAAKIGESIILDPSYEEEQVMDARLTITVDKDNNICAAQKGGLGTFPPSEIHSIIDKAIPKSSELRSRLLEAVKTGQS
ncbi:MAG: exosome complex protein Rrp42 [Candidatus Bathyarchaeia archaeon]